jgi:hypothetical protein
MQADVKSRSDVILYLGDFLSSRLNFNVGAGAYLKPEPCDPYYSITPDLFKNNPPRKIHQITLNDMRATEGFPPPLGQYADLDFNFGQWMRANNIRILDVTHVYVGIGMNDLRDNEIPYEQALEEIIYPFLAEVQEYFIRSKVVWIGCGQVLNTVRNDDLKLLLTLADNFNHYGLDYWKKNIGVFDTYCHIDPAEDVADHHGNLRPSGVQKVRDALVNLIDGRIYYSI